MAGSLSTGGGLLVLLRLALGVTLFAGTATGGRAVQAGKRASAPASEPTSSPRPNLLEVGRGSQGRLIATANRSRFGDDMVIVQPMDADFFTADAEKMDEIPDILPQNKKCHGKCTWNCETPTCNTACEPVCQPPKCVTACQKPVMSKCRQVCQEPTCAVVCPEKECQASNCPKCRTVCNKPQCVLDCGQGRMCESSCQDPVCQWHCKPKNDCVKPVCKMQCETPKICPYGETKKLPDPQSAYYYGKEVVWQGLGRVPAEHLAMQKALAPEGALMPEGASMPTGAQGLEAFAAPSPGPAPSQVNVEPASISETARWVNLPSQQLAGSTGLPGGGSRYNHWLAARPKAQATVAGEPTGQAPSTESDADPRQIIYTK